MLAKRFSPQNLDKRDRLVGAETARVKDGKEMNEAGLRRMELKRLGFSYVLIYTEPDSEDVGSLCCCNMSSSTSLHSLPPLFVIRTCVSLPNGPRRELYTDLMRVTFAA